MTSATPRTSWRRSISSTTACCMAEYAAARLVPTRALAAVLGNRYLSGQFVAIRTVKPG
jgi:hypothetical protein